MSTRHISKPFMIGAAVMATAAGITTYVLREQYRPPVLEIYVLNLKSGRSVFLRTPGDKRILIDGGANSEVIRELTHILPFYSRRIDTLIATSDDPKDVTGLIEALDRYAVNRLILPALTLADLDLASTTSAAFEALLQTAKDKKVPIERVGEGKSIDLEPGLVTADVLFPATSDKFQYTKASAPTMVVEITHKQDSLLLLGDATTKIQKYIAQQGTTTANVLIVSNSASAADLIPNLMDQVRPEYLVYAKSSKNKSDKKDPLYWIMSDHRFNVKEGTVKIVSNGSVIKIQQ